MGLLYSADLINVSFGSTQAIWAFISLPKGDSKAGVLVKGSFTFKFHVVTA